MVLLHLKIFRSIQEKNFQSQKTSKEHKKTPNFRLLQNACLMNYEICCTKTKHFEKSKFLHKKKKINTNYKLTQKKNKTFKFKVLVYDTF